MSQHWLSSLPRGRLKRDLRMPSLWEVNGRGEATTPHAFVWELAREPRRGGGALDDALTLVLPRREAVIVRRYYVAGDPWRRIADDFDLSTERTRQIGLQGIRRLVKHFPEFGDV